MTEEAYRYRFDEGVDLHQAEETLLLSVLATEGLYGQARVRMDAAYSVDKALRAIIVDASTDVGQALSAIFTAFILREFGSGRVHVRRVERLFARGGQEGGQ
jgi:hypothetical protein